MKYLPDKIYLHPAINDKNRPAALWMEKPSIFKDEAEYIRKDALMEWAKKKQYESLTIVADNFWQEVIDKIESL